MPHPIKSVDEAQGVIPSGVDSPAGESQDLGSNRSATNSTKVWIVIPAFNEAERIGRVLSDLLSHGRANVLVVDDGSGDRTAEVAALFDVWVLRHIVNRGQGAALQTGIEFALHRGADSIVTFDADGQHSASDLPFLLAPIHSGDCDVALGSRFLGDAPGIPLIRRMLLKLAVLGTRLTTRLAVTDTHNGLRAMTADAARKITLREDGMAHASEFLSKLSRTALRWCEVPVTIRYSDQTLEKGQKSSDVFHVAFRVLVAKVVG